VLKKGVVVLLAAATVSLASDLSQAPSADLLARYQQLRTIALDPQRIAVVEEYSLHKHEATFLLKSGQLCFLQPVGEAVVGAVFVGDGMFTLKPPTEIEQRNLARFTNGKSEVEDKFNRAVFFFTDGTAASLIADLKLRAGTLPAGAAEALNGFRETLRDDLKINLAAQLLADLANTGQGQFVAALEGSKCGRLLLNADPRNREEIELVRYTSRPVELWTAFRPGGRKLEDKAFVDHTRFKLDTTLEGTTLRGEARMEFTSLVDGPRVVPMRLAYDLRVSKVTSGDNQALKFVQEEKKKDGDLWVIMPAPLRKGEKNTVNLSYSGDDVVESAGNGNFYVGARTSWYPSISLGGDAFSDEAVYDMTFRTPKRYQVVATGRLVSRRDDGRVAVSEWASDVPFRVAGFNYGDYKSKSRSQAESQVTVYANPQIGDELAGLRNLLEINPQFSTSLGITTGGFNTTGMMDRALEEAAASMKIFTHYFGPIPYKSLSITQQPSGQFGQSWPTLVFLPYTALLDDTIKNQLKLDQGSSKRFFDEVGSHEVAHQWWGHTVGCADYHDEWLSEGFAQFSAGLFLHLTGGDDKLKVFLQGEKDVILSTRPGVAKPFNDAGPVWLGRRLETEKSPGAYRLIYSKGGYVLHMLRMMLTDLSKHDDSRFIALMRDFTQTWTDRNPTTDDFKLVCDKHFRQDMSWFFNQWVYGTEVPKVNVRYSLSKTSDGVVWKTQVLLERVRPNFRLVLPVALRYRKGGNSAKFVVNGEGSYEIKLPEMPESVEYNPLHAMLCDLEVKRL
jgi:hypothetical protein